MTITLTSAARLPIRIDTAYGEQGFTYYTVRAPHVRGTFTVHPEAPAAEGDDPDAYTWLCVTFGRYDPAESPSSYTDRVSVYNSWLYGGITLVPQPQLDARPHLRDPWNHVHRNPYELAEPPTRARLRDVGEALIAHHLSSPERHRQHAAYLRHIAPGRLERITREADSLASAVRRLGSLETRQRRWTRFATPGAAPGYQVTISGHLAAWLDDRFAGCTPLSDAERALYLAWSAANRDSDRDPFRPARRVNLPGLGGITALIRHLGSAATQAPGAAARAGARSTLRHLAASRPELAALITVPTQENDDDVRRDQPARPLRDRAV